MFPLSSDKDPANQQEKSKELSINGPDPDQRLVEEIPADHFNGNSSHYQIDRKTEDGDSFLNVSLNRSGK